MDSTDTPQRISNAANPLPLSVDEDDRERFERQNLASDSSIEKAAISNNDRTRTLNGPTSTDDVMIPNTNRSLKPELNEPRHPTFTETLSEKAHEARDAISHALDRTEERVREDAAYVSAKAKEESAYIRGKASEDAEYLKSEARSAEKSIERSLDRPTVLTSNTQNVGASGSALPTSTDDQMMTSTDYATTAPPVVDRSL